MKAEVPIIYKPVHLLQTKSMDWFLYDRDLRPERVKKKRCTYDTLRDLVPFLQFKKCEKLPWSSVTVSKVVG